MTAGAEPIETIINAFVTVEQSITTPTGWNDPIYWTDLTGNPNTFPAWLNVPETLDSIVRSAGTRTGRYAINAYLIFASGEYNYASAQQRAWAPLVLDAFDNNVKLSQTVQDSEIVRVGFAPVDINGVPFVALTFEFELIVSEDFVFSA